MASFSTTDGLVQAAPAMTGYCTHSERYAAKGSNGNSQSMACKECASFVQCCWGCDSQYYIDTSHKSQWQLQHKRGQMCCAKHLNDNVQQHGAQVHYCLPKSHCYYHYYTDRLRSKNMPVGQVAVHLPNSQVEVFRCSLCAQ